MHNYNMNNKIHTTHTHLCVLIHSIQQMRVLHMCVCVPRPPDVVAPQGRRLRIARGGSGRYRLHCLILCGRLCTESEILPPLLALPR